MADTKKDDWPYWIYLVPRDDVFALGVISLNYGRLENAFRYLFLTVTNMRLEHVAAVFHRLQNPARIAVFQELIPVSDLPEWLHAPLSDFADGFGDCAEQRHAIMHSYSTGHHTTVGKPGERGIVLLKYSKSGRRLVCAANQTKLRAIADDMDALGQHGAALDTYIKHIRTLRAAGHDYSPVPPTPLPDKPQLQAALDWLPLNTGPDIPFLW